MCNKRMSAFRFLHQVNCTQTLSKIKFENTRIQIFFVRFGYGTPQERKTFPKKTNIII